MDGLEISLAPIPLSQEDNLVVFPAGFGKIFSKFKALQRGRTNNINKLKCLISQEVVGLSVKLNTFHLFYLLLSFPHFGDQMIGINIFRCFIVDYFLMMLHRLIARNKSDNTK